MKPKNFILLFIFGLFLFLLPSGVEAFCNATILRCDYNFNVCAIQFTGPLDFAPEPIVGITSESSGQYELPGGSITQCCVACEFPWGTATVDYCADSAGWSASTDGIPTVSGRQFCTVIHNVYSFPGCRNCIEPGRIDSEVAGKCVQCNFATKTEVRLLGTASQLYDPCPDPPGVVGDGDCESACGADPECDEETYEADVSVSGGECDYCVFYPDEPDLIITDIWTDGNTIRYTIRNQGGTSADSSRSYLDVDGSYETYDSVSSLSASTSSNESFSYDWIANCTGLSDTFRVCADGGSVVFESNEGNNCREEVFNCPLPDFRITDVWFEPPDKRVHYTIQNQGDVSAASSTSYLYVNGSYERADSVSTISAGANRDEYFSGWDDCIGNQDYSIEVCADKAGPSGAAASGDGDVDELDENNNCRTVPLTCPAECTGDINASPETATAPCNYTIEIYDIDYCQGLTWEVTRDGSHVDSGTVTGETNWNRTISDSGVGVDSSVYYRLYIDGDEKDYDRVTCQEEVITTCAEAGGNCKENTCSTYQDCSSATENYDCSGATPYCCLGSCTTLPPEFDFSISVDPDFGSVVQGDSTSPSTVTATLITGTSQAVSFYVGSGLPSDASAYFNPPSCNPTCTSSMIISTSATTPPGVYQLTVCGTTGPITNCYSYYELTVAEAGPSISPPEVRTVPISEQGTVTTDSATIWGELTDMGGAASCWVWFEYKKSADEVWTKVCEMTSIGSFSCDLTDLTSNTAYDFEAFAKNGGSW